ncbi:hypothetical protein ASZ90_015830 [hydrocarbon metagenome]|uniref:Uncharacterized protein n=1 Tax=hydrocarbon metagenome TaxID=938273 RepID=A0A0W8F121_9ZZZZ
MGREQTDCPERDTTRVGAGAGDARRPEFSDLQDIHALSLITHCRDKFSTERRDPEGRFL